MDTIGNCQRLVFSLGVSQHMHKITNLLKFELDWSSELWDNYERKKTPLSPEVVCFQMLDFETSIKINSKLEFSKPNSWKITSRKLHHFRGSHFSHCFILPTSPQLVTKQVFMLITILSNYQYVSTAFKDVFRLIVKRQMGNGNSPDDSYLCIWNAIFF